MLQHLSYKLRHLCINLDFYADKNALLFESIKFGLTETNIVPSMPGGKHSDSDVTPMKDFCNLLTCTILALCSPPDPTNDELHTQLQRGFLT